MLSAGSTVYWDLCFKPLQNGAVLRSSTKPPSYRMAVGVSNPFKTGRYCVERHPAEQQQAHGLVSNPFKTGRYCVEFEFQQGTAPALQVSNPFKTGRYCVVNSQAATWSDTD